MLRFGRIGRTRALIITLPVAAILAGAAVYLLATRTHEPASATPDPTSSPTAVATLAPLPTLPPSPTATATVANYFGPFDGMPMSDEEWEARRDLPPLAVMIDNASDAFPHYGLEQADIIYEALVEGGITRLMVVYWRQDATRIEPVRSARTPFLVWASEIGAWYGHAGSAETSNAANAAGQLYEWGIDDLDAFLPAIERYYYRDTARYAPHNLVTSTSAMREAGELLGYSAPGEIDTWQFKDDHAGTASLPAAGGIEVNFGPYRDIYRLSQWEWDAKTNRYLRFTNGGPERDGTTGKQLAVANVIVMEAPAYVLETTHVVYEQIGEGPAKVFLDGKVIEGTWRKASRTARTRFYDATGEEIAFNRGQTFIQVVNVGALVQFGPDIASLPQFPVYEYSPPVQGGGGSDDFDHFDEFEDDDEPGDWPTATPWPTDDPDEPGDWPTATPDPGDDPTFEPGTPEPTFEPSTPESTAEPDEPETPDATGSTASQTVEPGDPETLEPGTSEPGAE